MNNKEKLSHYQTLSNLDTISDTHIDYLKKIKNDYNFQPKVIYDIGSSVLHWTKVAEQIWSDSDFYLFDATDTLELLYKETDYNYHIGVLSDTDDKEVKFYQSDFSPAGNSYYKENSSFTDLYYGEESEKAYKTKKLDTIIKEKKFPKPDFVKIDVQGSEVDVLKGMTETLKNVKHLVIEHQHSEYNIGAPLSSESVPFVESLGFKLIKPLFCNNGPDGDYHYIRI